MRVDCMQNLYDVHCEKKFEKGIQTILENRLRFYLINFLRTEWKLLTSIWKSNRESAPYTKPMLLPYYALAKIMLEYWLPTISNRYTFFLWQLVTGCEAPQNDKSMGDDMTTWFSGDVTERQMWINRDMSCAIVQNLLLIQHSLHELKHVRC